jgi:hypothetical protein
LLQKKPATFFVAGFTIRSLTALVTTSACQFIASTIDAFGASVPITTSPGRANPLRLDSPPVICPLWESTNRAIAGLKNYRGAVSFTCFPCPEFARQLTRNGLDI